VSSDQKKKGDLPNTWKDGSGMLTNGPLVRYYVHISVPLPQHKCFDLVRYFFRVPPCPPPTPGIFFIPGENTLPSRDDIVSRQRDGNTGVFWGGTMIFFIWEKKGRNRNIDQWTVGSILHTTESERITRTI